MAEREVRPGGTTCHCGHPSSKSLLHMWFRFEPPIDDEPEFSAPYCSRCRSVVQERLHVEGARWESEMAAARLQTAEDRYEAVKRDYEASALPLEGADDE